MARRRPLVGIIMGSSSDGPTMHEAAAVLDELAVPYEMKVVSAHRMPHDMIAYAKDAEARGVRVIIAGAGGAAHLPGMVAATTTLPVLGVPIQSRALSGLDSLLSIVQMPAGVPVGTLAIGDAGAKNAALFAAQILALQDDVLRAQLDKRRHAQTLTAKKSVPNKKDAAQSKSRSR
jgi:5-(carboxyamino)imidazole ribonucleotide mutase